MMQLEEIIDLDKIKILREDILYDDRPVFVENVITDCDSWITWDIVGECLGNACLTNTYYLNKVNSKLDHVKEIRFQLDDDIPAQRHDAGGNSINTTRAPTGDTILSKQKTIIISDYERINPCVHDLINWMIETFHVTMDDHGVWPAEIDLYSGHCHVHCGLEGSNSYHPKCDGPNNFMFQVHGTQKITIYNNRATSLANVELDPFDTPEERQAIYDRFTILDEIIVKPGDLVYLPNRQFYYVEPLENTISIRIPLMLHGPLTVAY